MFKPDEVPKDAQLTATIRGEAVAVQMDVKTMHGDASADMVVLTVERPILNAGESLQVHLSLSHGASPPRWTCASVWPGTGSAWPSPPPATPLKIWMC